MIAKIGAFLLICLLASRCAFAACQVDAKATVKLSVTSNGSIVVPVEVNGQIGTFFLDTGASRSVVTLEGVQRLGLARDPWVSTTMQGLGGAERRPNAVTSSFSIGGVRLMRRTLNHDTSLTVATLPPTMVNGHPIDGLLGRDYLAVFDLELNMPGRSLTLYQVQDCSRGPLPSTAGYAAMPITILPDNSIIVPVTLDEHPVRALLDSGASASFLGLSGMFRLGLNVANLTGDPAGQVRGLGGHIVSTYRHKFKVMRVGAESIAAPVLVVAPIHLPPALDMLLGTDWLATRRVWISYATQQLFVRTQ